MQTVQSHLTPAVLQRHGQPDTTLVLGSSRFPVHRAYVSACSGVLSNLLSDFHGEGELRLLAGGGAAGTGDAATNGAAASAGRAAANQAPSAISNEQHFGLFLEHMYGSVCNVSSAEQATALLSHSAFWACPLVLPAADAFLANAVQVGELGAFCFNPYPDHISLYTLRRDDSRLVQYLELASAHRLRRLMAVCMPLVASMPPCKPSTSVLAQLDQPVLAALVNEMRQQSQQKQDCYAAYCSGRGSSALLPTSCLAGKYCKGCKAALELVWHKSSARIERALLAAGWGSA